MDEEDVQQQNGIRGDTRDSLRRRAVDMATLSTLTRLCLSVSASLSHTLRSRLGLGQGQGPHLALALGHARGVRVRMRLRHGRGGALLALRRRRLRHLRRRWRRRQDGDLAALGRERCCHGGVRQAALHAHALHHQLHLGLGKLRLGVCEVRPGLGCELRVRTPELRVRTPTFSTISGAPGPTPGTLVFLRFVLCSMHPPARFHSCSDRFTACVASHRVAWRHHQCPLSHRRAACHVSATCASHHTVLLLHEQTLG